MLGRHGDGGWCPTTVRRLSGDVRITRVPAAPLGRSSPPWGTANRCDGNGYRATQSSSSARTLGGLLLGALLRRSLAGAARRCNPLSAVYLSAAPPGAGGARGAATLHAHPALRTAASPNSSCARPGAVLGTRLHARLGLTATGPEPRNTIMGAWGWRPHRHNEPFIERCQGTVAPEPQMSQT